MPTDEGVQNTLRGILRDTVDTINNIPGDWEEFDVSEDYGEPRRVYAARASAIMQSLSGHFEAGALPELPNLQDHIGSLSYYSATFVDDQGRKIVGVRKAQAAKAILGAQNYIVRLIDNSLVRVEEKVLRLDRTFDALITNGHVFILDARRTDHIAGITQVVAAAASDRVQAIHDAVPFLDMSRIKDKIERHPKLARLAHSISSKPNLADLQQSKIEELAAAQGITFKSINGRLRCNVADETKLMELLDARRYHLDLTNTGNVPYRATARQRVSV